MKAYYCTTIERDEGDCEILFAKSNVAARRKYAAYKGFDFSGLEITRKPIFDKYAEDGVVPIKARLEDGWWYECTHCGRRISFDSDDDEMLYDDDHLQEIVDHNIELEFELEDFDRDLAAPPKNEPGTIAHKYEMMGREPKEASAARKRIEYRAVAVPLDPNAIRYEGKSQVFCNIQCQYEHRARVTRIDTVATRTLELVKDRFQDGSNFECKGWPYLEAIVDFNLPGFQYKLTWRRETQKLSYCLGDSEAGESRFGNSTEIGN